MKAKLGAIFLVSVLAIAGAGAAYALWFEDLYIYTDIETGTVDVEWSVGWYEDDETADKDTSYGGIYLSTTSDNLLRCWVMDAYPCIEYRWYFDVHCVGSIPVHFTPFFIEADNTLTEDMILDKEILIYRVMKNDDTEIIYNPPIPLWTMQLHEGDTAYGYLMLHFNNNLPQDDYLIFDIWMRAHQYNEEPDI